MVILKKTQSLFKEVMSTFTESDFDQMNCLLQNIKPMNYSIQAYLETVDTLDKSKDIIMYAGYNMALLDMMKSYTSLLQNQTEIQKVKTTYRDEILLTLKKRGTLLHKDLASELGISNSGLTAVMQQMNATAVKLVNVEEFSKFKTYSLTPIARQYAEKPKGHPLNLLFLHHVDRQGMAQGLERDFRLDARLLCVIFDQLPKALPAHGITGAIYKKCLFLALLHQSRPTAFQIKLQKRSRFTVKRNPAGPLSIPAYKTMLLQIHIPQLQSHQLRHSDTGGIQQTQHGPISNLLRGIGCRLHQ